MDHDTDDVDESELTADAGDRRTTVRRDWDRAGQPSVTIVEAIADVTDRSTTDLPPIHESVNPDALDALLTSGMSSTRVAFTYADSEISVSDNGVLEILVSASPTDVDDE